MNDYQIVINSLMMVHSNMKNDIEYENALYSDCESDLERAYFFASGRAHETGIVSKSVQFDIARAFCIAGLMKFRRIGINDTPDLSSEMLDESTK
jgi:hypothetical protein